MRAPVLAVLAIILACSVPNLASAEWKYIEDKDTFTDKPNGAAAVEVFRSDDETFTVAVSCIHTLSATISTGLGAPLEGDLSIRYRVGHTAFRDTKWYLTHGVIHIEGSDWTDIMSKATDTDSFFFTIRGFEPYGPVLQFGLAGLQEAYRKVWAYCKASPGSYDIDKWPAPAVPR